MAKEMRYLSYRDLPQSVRSVYQRGGQFQKAADAVSTILGRMHTQEEDPFRGYSVTRHGETRIEHCVKYDLNGFCRLITIQDNGLCVLCYLGNHDECDHWLQRNKGLTLAMDEKGELRSVCSSRDIVKPDMRIHSETNWDTGKLVNKIPGRYYDKIAEGIPRSTLMKFESLESVCSEEEVMSLACEIESVDKQNVLFDVFNKLRAGDVDGAKLSVDLYSSSILKVKELTPDEIAHAIEGDAFVDSETAAQLLKHFMNTADYREWMLFMGREQREVVNREYAGPAKLAGVSGSGKTCVVVKRAIRLAAKYPEGNILILTLNPALSRLIEHLVDYTCLPELRGRIIVRSFWQLCQSELRKFEPENFDRLYTDVTWKHDEHITDIWDEYYDPWKQREFYNRDASIMLPVHRELLTRGVFPKTYVAQEFDWVRSALEPMKRNGYLDVMRTGRHVPFERSDRQLILEGLRGWEDKMRDIGVIDDLGLAIALHRHIEKINPAYRCVLVDEAQDFGTLELQIVRRLVPQEENDIFLCGDLMQRITTKHHNLRASGVDVAGRSQSLKRNYRNSREILSAAYQVLKSNVNLQDIEDEDFEVLDPEYANFSTPKPLLLEEDSVEGELSHALAYLRLNFSESSIEQKACISIAGLTVGAIDKIGKLLGIPVLDGSINIQDARIVLADLAQLKGYEFDTVCILNCRSGVLPDETQPQAESFRDLSRLYVAMTRARRALILSYSKRLSPFLARSEGLFTKAKWKDHCDSSDTDHITIEAFGTVRDIGRSLDMTGEDFLYTKHAVGLIPRVQEQLLKTITGVRSFTGSTQTEWPTIRQFLEDASRSRPKAASIFGEKSYDDLRSFLKDKGLV